MAAKSKSRMLTDRDEIQQWAEERGAKPAAVRSTGGNDDVGLIRLDFPGYSGGDSLETIDWNDWFDKFEESNLALLVQDATAEGERSNFNKLVSRNPETARSEGQSKRSGSRSNRATDSRTKRASSSGRAVNRTSQGKRSSQTSDRRTSQPGPSRGKRKSTSGRSGTTRSSATRGRSAKKSSKATALPRKKNNSRKATSRSTRRAA